MALKKWTFICPDCSTKTDMGVFDDQTSTPVQTFCKKPSCGRGQMFFPNVVSFQSDGKYLIEDPPEPPKPAETPAKK